MKNIVNTFNWSLIFCLIFSLVLKNGDCQSIEDQYFISPVDHEIRLSGSFGELRTNHFHSGIDIKSSKGTQGDTIRAAASGFVSRIKIEYGGYGKAIYIDHPNGTTTVYAHMHILSDTISNYVLKHQKLQESYAVDLEVNRNEILVEQGDYIALMGNQGRSYGPHLHFEIRNTNSEKPINPFLYKLKPNDAKKPILNQVFANVLTADFAINDRVLLSTNTDKFEISAWRLGISFNAYDQMDGANNKNGIYAASLTVDDSLIYTMKLDSFSFDETRSINGLIDFERKKIEKQTLVQCYRLPGNHTSVIKHTNDKLGVIDLSEHTYKKIHLKIYDFDKNITDRILYIKRKPEMKEYPSRQYHKLLKVNQSNLISHDGFQLIVPESGLFRNCYFRFAYNKCSSCTEMVQLSLGDNTTPINQYMDLYIQLDSIEGVAFDKLVLLNTDTNTSYGGNCQGKVLDTAIDAMGNYAVVLDTIPPTLTLVKNNLKNRGVITVKMIDNMDTRGQANDLDYSVKLNDQWIVGEYSSQTKLLTIDINNIKLQKRTNKLEIVAWDDRKNYTRKTFDF